MGQVSHRAGAVRGQAGRVRPLQQEPQAQHQPRRDAQRDEQQERHQAPHPGPRVQHQVRAEHAGDRAGRADQRRDRVRVGQREPVRRGVPAGQVEEQERQLAHAVLDVVAEHHQEQHVAEQVQPARVQEHRPQHRQRRRLAVRGPFQHAADALRADRRLAGRHQPQRPVADQLAGDRRVPVVERGLPALRGRAGAAHQGAQRDRGEQQDGHVDRDQRVGHPRGPADRVDVVDRDNHIAIVP